MTLRAGHKTHGYLKDSGETKRTSGIVSKLLSYVATRGEQA